MTDKPKCTGLYKNRFDIQVNEGKFYVATRGGAACPLICCDLMILRPVQ